MPTQLLTDKVATLIEIISQEASVFEEFLMLLGRQQEMVVRNDNEGHNRITSLQREKVVESQLLNRQRENLIIEIKTANLVEGDLNVSRLIELVNEDQGSRLFELRNIISGLNTKINEVRDQNAMLLKRSREYFARTMELLSKIKNPHANCARNGLPTGSGSEK